jgi:ribosomal protein S18 acetylase RimI-like enzyme
VPVVAIRPAKASDAGAAVALWTEAYSGQGPEGRVAPYEEATFFAAADRGEPFVAEASGAVLGAVVFYRPGAPGSPTEVAGEAGLRMLAVRREARGEGIGRELALQCERRAREERAEAIVLWSRPYQVEAHRLYESLGYRRAPERDGSDPEGRQWVFVHELGDRR